MRISTRYKGEWEQHLVDWWQNSYSKRVVRFKRKYWFVKCFPPDGRAAERERLAYLLGRDLANIAEVRLLHDPEFDAIRNAGVELPSAANRPNTYLVRLGFDYPWLSLPIKDLDHAVAAELVFSLWIRRRDAHSFNRVYVRGVPVFFDHLTALLGEPDLADLDRFFSQGPDPGYAAWWQIAERQLSLDLDIRRIRHREKEAFEQDISRYRVLHLVKRRDRFRTFLFRVARRIRMIPDSHIIASARQAGFNENESRRICEFLGKTRNELEIGLERLCSMFRLNGCL